VTSLAAERRSVVTKGLMTPATARARRALRQALAVSLALALASAGSGCSFAKLRPPPPPSTWPEAVLPDTSELQCTSTSAIPVVDSAIFVGLGTIAFVERNAVTYDASQMPKADVPSRALAGVLGIGALVAAASAVYGYVETSRCRRYKAIFHPQ
jgi:hypothetical protein